MNKRFGALNHQQQMDLIDAHRDKDSIVQYWDGRTYQNHDTEFFQNARCYRVVLKKTGITAKPLLAFGDMNHADKIVLIANSMNGAVIERLKLEGGGGWEVVDTKGYKGSGVIFSGPRTYRIQPAKPAFQPKRDTLYKVKLKKGLYPEGGSGITVIRTGASDGTGLHYGIAKGYVCENAAFIEEFIEEIV